jgi:hypothetical protein
VSEGKDKEVVVAVFPESVSKVARGKTRDAKTIIALQHPALYRAGEHGGVM